MHYISFRSMGSAFELSLEHMSFNGACQGRCILSHTDCLSSS